MPSRPSRARDGAKALLREVAAHEDDVRQTPDGEGPRVLCPALGTGTGRVPPEEAARQMALAFRNHVEAPTGQLSWDLALRRYGELFIPGKRRLRSRAARGILWPRMQLLIVRHAEAAQGDPDELRPLTAAGREQARSLGTRLRDEGVRPDAILTSPLLRARETGDLLARELGGSATPDERLAPGTTSGAVAEAAAASGATVVVVGHQPDCSQVAAALSGGPEPAFPPAGVVAVEL